MSKNEEDNISYMQSKEVEIKYNPFYEVAMKVHKLTLGKPPRIVTKEEYDLERKRVKTASYDL